MKLIRPKDARSRGFALGLLLLMAVFTVQGCSRGRKAAPPPGAPVNVAAIRSMDVPLEIAAIGSVEAYSSVAVKSLVTGQLLQAHFKEGQDVRKGDLLFTIDPGPFRIALAQAEALLARDEVNLKNAEDDLARYADLVEKDYVTRESYEQLRANAEALRATVKADGAAVDNARLQLAYCTIRSPIDGRTGGMVVHPGNLVKANDTTALIVINQVVPINVAFAVPQQNLALVRKYREAGPLKTSAAPKDNPAPVEGTLTFVDNAVDTSTGTILLKAEFVNTDHRLWPGQYVDVRLLLTVEKDRVVCPTVAIQTGQTGQYVMVVKEDLTAELRPVEVARSYRDEAVIGAGLKPGERVATDGLLRLAPGVKVEIRKPVGEEP